MTQQTTKVFVGSIPHDIKEDELRAEVPFLKFPSPPPHATACYL